MMEMSAPIDTAPVTQQATMSRWTDAGIHLFLSICIAAVLIALMWTLRAAYHLGAHPRSLARYYRDAR